MTGEASSEDLADELLLQQAARGPPAPGASKGGFRVLGLGFRVLGLGFWVLKTVSVGVPLYG